MSKSTLNLQNMQKNSNKIFEPGSVDIKYIENKVNNKKKTV